MTAAKHFHMPSLDGIRAVAALVVFFSHAGWGHVVPGGLGVTIFFFLSGYLITTLLRREYTAHGKLNLSHFYLRRAWRILPPMYLILALCLGLGMLGLTPNDATVGGVLSQVFQVSNYYWIVSGDAGLINATRAFWSLSVEEHFYLVYPLLLLAGLRRGAPVRLMVALCIAVLVWRCILVYGFHVPPGRTYLGTDTRFDSLLYGCILGLWHNPALEDRERDLAPMWRALAVLFGLGVIALTLVVRSDQFRETLRYTLQGIACIPLFWVAVRYAKWGPIAVLNWAPMVWLGKLSYTFYLVHFLAIQFCSRWFPGKVPAALGAFVLSVVAAIAMYHYVEQPCARRRARLADSNKQVKLTTSAVAP